jgi:hypothetical protein
MIICVRPEKYGFLLQALIKPHKVSDHTLIKSQNTIKKIFIKETKIQTKQLIHVLQYLSAFERLTKLQK